MYHLSETLVTNYKTTCCHNQEPQSTIKAKFLYGFSYGLFLSVSFTIEKNSDKWHHVLYSSGYNTVFFVVVIFSFIHTPANCGVPQNLCIHRV
jgi:hypothetical protein